MKFVTVLSACLFFSMIASAADESQVLLIDHKEAKAVKITGKVAKEMYEVLAKKSAQGDYKYGNGITCTTSSAGKEGKDQCVLLLNKDGIQ